MGSMASPARSIDRLHFEKLPSKPTKGTVVQLGTLIVMRGERGALYTNAQPLNRKVHCSGAWHWSESMVEALDLLGVLTPEDRKAHEQWLAKLKARSDAVEALADAQDAAKVKGLGITQRKLTKLWDALDWYGQREFTRYRKMPQGSAMKPQPEPFGR